jgi:WD40 repeat protein
MPNVWCQEMRCVKYFTPGDNAQQAAKSVAISPGGEFVVIADGGNRLKVWNSSNGSIVATVGDNANVSAVTFTPDGRRLVLGAVDGSVSSWDSTSWKKVGIWEPHPSSVFCIQFSTNGKQAATGGMDGSIALRNASTGHIDTNLASHNQAINGLAFDGKRNTLLSSSLDEIRVWDSASGTQVSSLKHADETNGATALAISPTGDYVAAGCPEKNTITIWNLESKTLAHRLVISTSEVTALRFSLDGTQLTSASMDGSIRTWDVHTGKSLGTRRSNRS